VWGPPTGRDFVHPSSHGGQFPTFSARGALLFVGLLGKSRYLFGGPPHFLLCHLLTPFLTDVRGTPLCWGEHRGGDILKKARPPGATEGEIDNILLGEEIMWGGHIKKKRPGEGSSSPRYVGCNIKNRGGAGPPGGDDSSQKEVTPPYTDPSAGR